MFAAREFILGDSADRWTQVVDNSDADGGAWAMTGYSHGGYGRLQPESERTECGIPPLFCR